MTYKTLTNIGSLIPRGSIIEEKWPDLIAYPLGSDEEIELHPSYFMLIKNRLKLVG